MNSRQMRLGIGSYTYPWTVGVAGYPVAQPMTVWALLAQAQALGVQVVQIADNLPLDQLDADERQRLAQAAQSMGIALEVGTRGIAPDHLRHYLQIAQQLGSPILRVVIDSGDHHPAPDEVVATLRPLLPEFAAARITLAIENHDRFRTPTLVEMLKALDSPWVGVCLDTVNSFGALEGPDVVVAALGPWTVNLHVKDFTVRRANSMLGFVVEGRPAGAGMLDVAWLLGQLQAMGRSCNAIIELWTPPEADMDATLAKEAAWAHTSVVNMRQLVGTNAAHTRGP